METMKGIGAFALGICVLVAIWAVIDIFLYGVAYVSAKLIPWLIDAAYLAFFIDLLLLLPLSFFRRSRVFSCFGFMACSYAFGICGWVFGFLVSYSLWGFLGLAIGLFIFGVGVVPVAMVAAAFHGSWNVVWELLALIILTFGTRAYAMHLAAKADQDEFERSTITLEAR
jgi:hypothetical protein